MTPLSPSDALPTRTDFDTRGSLRHRFRACLPQAAFLLLGVLAGSPGWAQGVPNPGPLAPSSTGAFAGLSVEDEASLEAALRALAAGQLARLPPQADPSARFRLRLVAGHYQGALEDIAAARQQRASTMGAAAASLFVQHEVWLRAQLKFAERATQIPASETAVWDAAFTEVFSRFEDLQAFDAFGAFLGQLPGLRAQLEKALDKAKGETAPSAEAVEGLLRRYLVYRVYRDLLPRAETLMAADDRRRYQVKEDVLIPTPHGVTLSAMRMHKADGQRRPALMFFTIYADEAQHRNTLREMAARGYAGIVVDARGKRLGPDKVAPYEHEGEDAHAAIDWISRQDWNDGRVAMTGGSYSGFAQWAAARHGHPALKAIVPAVAAIPGQGVPMENNVFLNANYGWAFYVTNQRLLDTSVYQDRDRWTSLNIRWFESGRPYRELDGVDGTPNPWLQKWLKHPSFDTYWQKMAPWGAQFAGIRIPVLSITGYFDDGQISALHYYREHLRHNPRADHTLLMGPWDHFGAQGRPAPELQGYRVDPAAVQPVNVIIFQWLDHVLKGGPRPALLADRVNLQIMGSNTWLHAPSLQAAAPEVLRFHLQPAKEGRHHMLASRKPLHRSGHVQTVHLADRTTQNNRSYYPWPIVRDTLDVGDAPVFVSEPLDAAYDVVGRFSADLAVRINKRDVDLGLTLYEQLPDGRYFHLGYFLGRASFAKDPTRRQLLVPGAVTRLPVTRSRMTARRVAAGSRLVLVADVNKNQHAQVNHGTGKDVSEERAEDGKEPLTMEWLSDSVLRVPVRRVGANEGPTDRKSSRSLRPAASNRCPTGLIGAGHATVSVFALAWKTVLNTSPPPHHLP